jgi:subtilisin family serine protease
MKRAIAVAAAVSVVGVLAIPAAAKEKEQPQDSYVVMMTADPLVREVGQDNLDTKKAKKLEATLKSSHKKALAGADVSPSRQVNEYTVALNGFSALLTKAEAEEVAKQAGVAFVAKDVFRERTTDSSGEFLDLDAPAGPWQTGLTGEGVVVGVIDDGIWPEHPSFADDGSFPTLPRYADVPCEFGNTDHNPDDAPFECNDKLLGARQMLATYRALIGADPDEFDSARDDNGHGTHTASTAAGNAGVEASVLGLPRGTVSGVAPRARVIAYKGLGNLGGFGSDLAAAIDQAVADGVDVINYSVGGGASLTGADDIAFLFAADAGVFAATSAGNNGPGDGTVGGPGSVPWLTTVGASTQTRSFAGEVVLGDGSSYQGVSITAGTDEQPLVDAADAGDELCAVGALDPAVVAGKIVLCKRGTYARVAKSEAVYVAGGAGMVLYNVDDATELVSDTHWVPSVHVNFTAGSAIKDYIAAEGADATASIVSLGTVDEPAPVMAAFSSRGPDPVAEDIIKPDITGPGVQILAGWSPFPDQGEVPGELFAAIAGTSMSSPHVAGALALLKQAHPDWSPAMAKSALMTTAYQDVTKEDGVTPADPFDMGAGHMNPGGKTQKGSMFQPGLAYDAGFLDYLGFLCDAGPEVFANPEATCGSLESMGIATDTVDLNLPSIGVGQLAGSKTVTRTVTSVANDSGWRTYTASVDAPEGYEVTVSPSALRLKPGQSATFEVAITNVSAPIGAWRFGSLTWQENTGAYSAYSPIAVKGALFEAPDVVTGNGESGAASFDVSFGYTGSYSAAAHGLEPATVTQDTVPQDPDQTFDPNDGYSNAHTFDLSGAALFRVAIPPEAVANPDIDLDMFVYDPDGNQVATSTNGGTDEQIDITLPEDGTWTVYVHGWQTVAASADYDMYSWVVSTTPGGNLSIDSAPTSASLGATESVDLSWTGATTGQWHLGAVSHTGDSGLMGLTLVEVDNR